MMPSIVTIDVKEIGDVEISRTSTVELYAPLSAGNDPVIFTWPAMQVTTP